MYLRLPTLLTISFLAFAPLTISAPTIEAERQVRIAARASFEAQRPLPTDVLLAGIGSNPTIASKGWASLINHQGDLGGEKSLTPRRRRKSLLQRLTWWIGSYWESYEGECLKGASETEDRKTSRNEDLDEDL